MELKKQTKINIYPEDQLMKYIVTTALLTFTLFNSSCSCQLSGSASADCIIDPQEVMLAL